ncbi:MAG: glycosyltransferase family 2 protein [Opitutales bacterium]|nr:glycosyltransferase family 2 protein [Opitutales bacterium]
MTLTPTELRLSVALCCHNSEKRLPTTLSHLAQQEGMPVDLWEVLIIDNASSDQTSAVARKVWKKEAEGRGLKEVNFRIVRESRQGLSHARARAFKEAKGDVVCFLDDDNWVSSHWLRKVREIFLQYPDVAAAGGPITEVLEQDPPPDWFEEFKGNFTIWNPRDSSGYWNQPLCGAGLCVRRSAWERLEARGFRFMLSDRQGNNLSSGGDFELCYALMLSGWRLWYDPGLHIQHWMPQERIQWTHLKRLRRGFGAQSVVFDAYKSSSPPSWMKEVLLSAKALLSTLARSMFSAEGRRARVLFSESQIGRIHSLLKERSNYKRRFERLQSAPWRTTDLT